MELTTTTTPTKSDDSENDTPPHIQPIKSLSFTNGAIKNHNPHHHRHHQPPPPPPQAVVVTYRECLKNHAASIGGHAMDGCGEFMPASTANPTEPTSLTCAACGCHRNFHRREPDDYWSSPPSTTHFLDFQRRPPPPPGRFSSSPSPPTPQPSSYGAPSMLLALSTAVQDDHQPTNASVYHHHHVATPMTPTAVKGENSSGRKRFRTKFTPEQKLKMHSFAEKLGWKMHKSDEATIKEFCDEIGFSRSVLKVWMHNNKHTFAKKDTNKNSSSSNINIPNMSSINGVENGRVVGFDQNNNGVLCENENNGSLHLHVSTNGSSSSS